jgi:hypothetical protein
VESIRPKSRACDQNCYWIAVRPRRFPIGPRRGTALQSDSDVNRDAILDRHVERRKPGGAISRRRIAFNPWSTLVQPLRVALSALRIRRSRARVLAESILSAFRGNRGSFKPPELRRVERRRRKARRLRPGEGPMQPAARRYVREIGEGVPRIRDEMFGLGLPAASKPRLNGRPIEVAVQRKGRFPVGECLSWQERRDTISEDRDDYITGRRCRRRCL